MIRSLSRPVLLLAAAALALASLAACRERRTQGGNGAAPAAAAGPRTRVMLIGIDGMTWSLTEDLMRRGMLPSIQRQIDRGTSGVLLSLNPMVSPALWTSIATGKVFAKHGISDFVVRSPSGQMVPVTSNLRRTKALWNILSDHGLRSVVVNYYVTFPVEPIRGTMVSRLSISLRSPVASRGLDRLVAHPEAAGIDLKRLTGEFLKDVDSDETFVQMRELMFVEKVALHFGQQPWDFLAVYVHGIDEAEHLFWKYRDPQKFDRKEWEITAQGIRDHGTWIDELYQRMDVMVGRLVAMAGPDAVVIICSDHGQVAAPDHPDPEEQKPGPDSGKHVLAGVLIMAGPDVVHKLELPRASLLDIAPTVLHLLGLPVGQDMDGKVLLGAIDPRRLARRPVTRIPSHDQLGPKRQFSTKPVASAMDEAIIKRLKSLGYLAE